jgi:hypothetical protein
MQWIKNQEERREFIKLLLITDVAIMAGYAMAQIEVIMRIAHG